MCAALRQMRTDLQGSILQSLAVSLQWHISAEQNPKHLSSIKESRRRKVYRSDFYRPTREFYYICNRLKQSSLTTFYICFKCNKPASRLWFGTSQKQDSKPYFSWVTIKGLLSWTHEIKAFTSVLRHSWDVHSRSSAPQPPDWRERFSRRPSRWCWTPGWPRVYLVQTPAEEDKGSRDSMEALPWVGILGCISECALGFFLWNSIDTPNTSETTVKGWRGTVASVYRVTWPSRLESLRTECDSCHLEPAQPESITVGHLQTFRAVWLFTR